MEALGAIFLLKDKKLMLDNQVQLIEIEQIHIL